MESSRNAFTISHVYRVYVAGFERLCSVAFEVASRNLRHGCEREFSEEISGGKHTQHS